MSLISLVIMAAATVAPIDDSALACSQIATLATELEAQAEHIARLNALVAQG